MLSDLEVANLAKDLCTCGHGTFQACVEEVRGAFPVGPDVAIEIADLRLAIAGLRRDSVDHCRRLNVIRDCMYSGKASE